MLSFTSAVLRLVQRPWLDIYERLNNDVSLRFPTYRMYACTCGCSFICSQLLFLGPSYNFVTVIVVTRYVMWSVLLCPADHVGGREGKEHGYAFPSLESGRTVLPWPCSGFPLHSLLSPSCEPDVFWQNNFVKWKSP